MTLPIFLFDLSLYIAFMYRLA